MFQPKTRYIFSRKTKSSLTKSSESNQQLTKYKHYETRLMISVEWDVCLGKGDFLKLWWIQRRCWRKYPILSASLGYSWLFMCFSFSNERDKASSSMTWFHCPSINSSVCPSFCSLHHMAFEAGNKKEESLTTWVFPLRHIAICGKGTVLCKCSAISEIEKTQEIIGLKQSPIMSKGLLSKIYLRSPESSGDLYLSSTDRGFSLKQQSCKNGQKKKKKRDWSFPGRSKLPLSVCLCFADQQPCSWLRIHLLPCPGQPSPNPLSALLYFT